MVTAVSGEGPLDGVRVLDFTNMLSGPYCTRLLAALEQDTVAVLGGLLGYAEDEARACSGHKAHPL